MAVDDEWAGIGSVGGEVPVVDDEWAGIGSVGGEEPAAAAPDEWAGIGSVGGEEPGALTQYWRDLTLQDNYEPEKRTALPSDTYEKAGARAAEAVTPSTDPAELMRRFARNPVSPGSIMTGGIATGLEGVARPFADEPGLARSAWEALTGEKWLEPEEIDLLPGELQKEVRRRQAGIFSFPEQAIEMGRALIDLPVQGVRGVGHMVEDVSEGKFGDAIDRPLGMAATMGAEMVRSAGKTGEGDLGGRELEAGLDLAAAPHVIAGPIAGAARASTLGGKVAGAARGLVTGSPEVSAGYLEALKRSGELIPGLSAKYPDQMTKTMVDDARFGGSAETSRALEELEGLSPEKAELSEAFLTQGDELVPQIRVETMEGRLATTILDIDTPEVKALADEITGGMGVSREQILADPDLTRTFIENWKELREIRRHNAEIDELAAPATQQLDDITLKIQREVAAGEKTALEAKDLIAKRKARVDAERARATKQDLEAAETRLDSAEALMEVQSRAADSIYGARSAAREAAVAEGKILGKDISRARREAGGRPETVGIDKPRKKAWAGAERGAWYKDGLGDAELRNFKRSEQKTVGQLKEAFPGRMQHGEQLAALLDPVNELLSRRKDSRFVDPHAAWMELTKGARSLDDVKHAAEAMRQVPGFENFDPLARNSKLEKMAARHADDANQAVEAERLVAQADQPGFLAQKTRQALKRGEKIGEMGFKEELAAHTTAATIRELEKTLARIERHGGSITKAERAAMRSLGYAEGSTKASLRAQLRRLREFQTQQKKAARDLGRINARRKTEGITKKQPRDPVKASLDALEKVDRTGGARLVLRTLDGADEVMNTPRAAHLDLGATDLRKAMDEGRLRATHPDPEMAKWLDDTVVPIIVRINEMGKEKRALGVPGMGGDQMRVQATNYMRAWYDAHTKRRFLVEEGRSRMAERADKLIDRVQSGELTSAEAKRLMAKSAKVEAAKIPDASAQSMGRQFGVFGKTDLGSMKRAVAKFKHTRDGQYRRGRWAASRAQEGLTRQMVEHTRIITNHRLFRDLSRTHHVLENMPGPVKDLGTMQLGSIGYGKESVAVIKYGQKRFVQMPAKRDRWGDLAGKLVDVDLAKRLVEINKLQANWYSRILSMWKKNKVVNNLSSQFHVAVGNVINQVLDGGTPMDLVRAARTYVSKEKGWLHRATRDAGIMEGIVMDVELDLLAKRKGLMNALRDVYDDTKFYAETTGRLETVAEIATTRGARELTNLGLGVAEWVTDNVAGLGGLTKRLFTAQEMASRMAILERFIKREAKRTGRTVEDLAADADVLKRGRRRVMDIQLDYGDLPDWAQTLRGTGVIPFISYPYKATGMFLRRGAEMPRRARAVEAAEGAVYELAGEDEQNRRDMVPGYRQGWTIPVTEQHDMFVRYMTPFTIFPFGEFIGKGSRQEGVQGGAGMGFVPGHIRWIAEIAENRDFFYDRPITMPTDEPETKAAKLVLHAATALGPGLMGRLMNNVFPAMKGETSGRGEDLSVGEALLNAAGLRVSKPDEDAAIREAVYKTKDTKALMLRHWRRLAARSKTTSTKEEARREARLIEILERIIMDAEYQRNP